MSDIVERLKDGWDRSLRTEASAEILRLRAENEKLRAALAEYHEQCVMIAEEFVEMPNGYFRAKSQKEIVADLRAAAAALKETDG